MKKLLSVILALSLLLSLALCNASADDGWADYTCEEQNFKTKIPLSGTSGYDDTAKGLKIYTDVPGYIPYVVVSRRPMDKKFNNPTNYLNNVYREYIENSYGDDCLGMNPASTWEIGGKELLGARYMYKISSYTIVHLQLIEVRDAGDVEYTAEFIEGEDAATMAALEEAVRYYQETDVIPGGDTGYDAAEASAPSVTADYAVPSFLTPSVFVGNYNAMINALADKYADALGEEGVQIVKENYTIVQDDIQGSFAWYGNVDWGIEAGFVFPDENSVSYKDPALQLNFNIRNDVPDAIMDFARYAIKMIIAYEYQNEVSLDDLSDWFNTADEPSNIFRLPGYELSTVKTDETTQYMFLLPADRNPFKPAE